jgi:hypothetical protein
MTNIIQFPNKNGFDGVLPDTEEHLMQVRRDFCDEVVSDVMDAVTAVVASFGFNGNVTQESIKDIVFIEEALKAFTYRFKGLEHSLHPIIDQTISITDDAKKHLDQLEKELT